MAIPKKKLQAFMKKEAPAPYRAKDNGEDEEPEALEASEAEEAGEDGDEEPVPEPEDEAEDEGSESDEGSEPEVDAEEIGAQVQAGNGSPKLMKLAKGVTEETNPPAWVADEDIWEKAKAAVEPKWDEYDEPFAVTAAVYKKMGGSFK